MPSTSLDRQRRYRENNPERVLENAAKYRARHRMSLRIETRIRERARRELWRQRVLAALGGKCSVCGFADPRALHVDHVNDDGKMEMLRCFKNDVVKYYKHICKKVGSGRYQLLCANHNQIKEWERRRRSRLSGEKSDHPRGPGRAKLDISKVRQIRSAYEFDLVSQKELAALFGVSAVTISHALNRYTWKE
jgi:hypothetical protein